MEQTPSSSDSAALAAHWAPRRAADRRVCGCTARSHLIAIATLLTAGIALTASGAILSMQVVLIVGSITTATTLFYATLFFCGSRRGRQSAQHPTLPAKYTVELNKLQSEEFWWKLAENEEELKKVTSRLDRHDVAAIPFKDFPADLVKDIYQALSSNVDANALQRCIHEKVLSEELLDVMNDLQISVAYGEIIAADILSQADSLCDKPLFQKYGITWDDLRDQQEKILYAIVNTKTVRQLNQLVEKILLHPELIKWRTVVFTTGNFITFLSQSNFDFVAFFKEIDLSATCVNFYELYLLHLVTKSERRAELEAIFARKSVTHQVLPLILQTFPQNASYQSLINEIVEITPFEFHGGFKVKDEASLDRLRDALALKRSKLN